MAHPTLSGIITEHPSYMWVIKPGGRVARGQVSRFALGVGILPDTLLDSLARDVMGTLGHPEVMAFGSWMEDGKVFEIVALEVFFLCRN